MHHCSVLFWTILVSTAAYRLELHRLPVAHERPQQWNRDRRLDGRIDGNYALVPLNIGTGYVVTPFKPHSPDQYV